MPLGLIVTSFLVYNNPFLKTVSLLLLPVLVALFYGHAFASTDKPVFWGTQFIGSVIVRCLAVLASIVPAARLHQRLLNTSRRERGLVKRILVGVFLMLAIAFKVVIPLLSSADAEFAGRVDFILQWVQEIISTTFFTKMLVMILFSLITLATLFAWSKKFSCDGQDGDGKPIDSIVAGIVLGGILAVYLVFLWVQVRQLWIGKLPFEFSEAVYLVKSGFWQLLFLSVVNILIYFFTYRKTVSLVQKILLAFSVASLFLLASAGHRVALYVTYYGFSYEKFFAAYTVLFCAIVFVWLISRLFEPRRADILRFLAALFLWMFAVMTVMPVEQFILRANVALANLEGSRIRIYELTMLSGDVLGTVKRFRAEGKLREVNPVYFDYDLNQPSAEEREQIEHPDWGPWIDGQQITIDRKKWYERTLMDWVN